MANPFGQMTSMGPDQIGASGAGRPNPFSGLDSLGLDYLNSNPTAGWGQYLNTFGLGSDPYSNWLRGQQSHYYNQYQGANANQPTLSWTDYMQQINPRQQFEALDPYSRGENPRSFTGRTRWRM